MSFFRCFLFRLFPSFPGLKSFPPIFSRTVYLLFLFFSETDGVLRVFVISSTSRNACQNVAFCSFFFFRAPYIYFLFFSDFFPYRDLTRLILLLPHLKSPVPRFPYFSVSTFFLYFLQPSSLRRAYPPSPFSKRLFFFSLTPLNFSLALC